MNRNPTKVFTDRGLYMLATILKGDKARDVTFAIIETFAKVRELKRELLELHKESDKEVQIRNTDKDEEEKERLIKETSNRIVQGEVWVLGTLAHLGHLAE